MNAYVFPGQGSQFPGMGKDLFDRSQKVKNLFSQASDILGFDIGDIMFNGSEEDLKETSVTQPAVFLHSLAAVEAAGNDFKPGMVAGHSLGEFSALTAAGSLNFADGLELVKIRAAAMQNACELEESTMAAIIGLEDELVEFICDQIGNEVVAANYNCPGQIVISGSKPGIARAIDMCKEKGARMAIELKVGGAFHSPFMKPAELELKTYIEQLDFKVPLWAVYQNFTAEPSKDPEMIKQNLVSQLTAPVRWTQTMERMIRDGANKFIEVGGNGKTLVTFVKRIDRKIPTEAI